jgi:hypothetical protein
LERVEGAEGRRGAKITLGATRVEAVGTPTEREMEDSASTEA